MPDTALAVAFEEAGYIDPVDELAREAWRKWPGAEMGGARRDFVRGKIQGSLAWQVIERWQPNAWTMAIGKLLNDNKEIEAERLSKGGGQRRFETQKEHAPANPAQAAGDRHHDDETQARRAVASTSPDRPGPQASGGSAPASEGAKPTTVSPAAPNLKDLADKQVAASRANTEVRLSLLDTFRINGTPIGDLTPNQARTWARNSSIPVRWITLLTANLPPNEPIRKHRRPEDSQALWKQAEDEARTAELESFRAA